MPFLSSAHQSLPTLFACLLGFMAPWNSHEFQNLKVIDSMKVIYAHPNEILNSWRRLSDTMSVPRTRCLRRPCHRSCSRLDSASQ